ncbi:MAG: phosphoribosylaminoimidazolesuccinocarboxamide synthase, partial [Dehalococcoidia bacterium]|nr:phosphoribosylaminoimidazolesuccinocarboxamide synthase [Dehalococcoidia bacterium]
LPLPLFRRGKVRDVYDLDDKLLIVATDRISAFDFVLPCGVPNKGKVLNHLSAFWFEKTAHIVPNHFIKVIDSLNAFQDVIARAESPKQSQKKKDSSLTLGTSLIGRSMLVAKAERIPVECVVRGYLSGSAWAEYKKSGTAGDIRLPAGMKESQELPHPIFTPTTKGEAEHDRPLTNQDIRNLEEISLQAGRSKLNLIKELEEKSLLIYRYARDYAKNKGIMIADTKFEFGFVNGELTLIDELLTPDSSRFWDASQYEVGHSQPSFDKQPVRDWLLASGWNREPPAPMLPLEVIEATTQRYNRIYQLFTGKCV